MKNDEKNIQIIFVDDNPDDTELIYYCFKKLGYEDQVRHFSNGKVFLDFLDLDNQDQLKSKISDLLLLILDIKMPKVDGFAVLKALRTNPGTKDLPVIILSSSKEERDIINAYSLGANAYLVKAVDYEELIKTIKSVASFWLTQNVTQNRLNKR